MGILITGGTGSFGRAFARYLLNRTNYQRICIYSRDEAKQASMFDDLGRSNRLRMFIGDIRDRERLYRAMEGISVVVHAAAMKRIESCHYNPGEMVKTNILGTMNVIEAAHDARVKQVVMLSTDKAYNPVSAYGHSKALAEAMILSANESSGSNGPRFAVTRYGNVAGSTGSVIPKWKAIADSAPKGCLMPAVPVTDPDCTRFWMTQDEAIHLVMNTINTMVGGELNIPNLPAYRLGDLASAMSLSMDVIGLPEYEKKHECMSYDQCSNTARRLTVKEIIERLNMLHL